MTAIKVDIRRRDGTLSILARGRSAEFGVAEVYLHGRENMEKADNLTARGTPPLVAPPEVLRMAREFARVGVRAWIKTGTTDAARRTLLAGAQYVAKWLRDRITSGLLGRNTPAGREIKSWLVDQGRATARYGDPPPYGVCTGHMVHSIKARWRPAAGAGRPG